jgi:hypothetical protein
LEVLIDETSVGAYTEDDLGCTSTGGDTFTCSGSGVQIGGSYGLTMDSWSLNLDTDPVINGVISVTNNGNVTQQFTMIFTLGVGPMGPSTLMGGSIQGGATDNTGNGVSLTTAAGSAFYTALIDGVPVQTLYGNPQNFSAGAFLSVNVPSLAFGTPIPSMPGPAVNNHIRIRLDFLLTPGDSASFTSNFVVLPIPEPGTAALLAFGLVGLALRRRRA